MKNLLELKNNHLWISPEALMIDEFKTIWNRDKSKSKDKALSELAYIYHSCDYQSIYREYNVDIRESKICLDIMGNRDWKPDEKIIKAQEKYKSLQKTLAMLLLEDVETGLGELRKYFKEPNLQDDENGVASKNFIANIKNIGEVYASVKKLREEVEKELRDKMQLRGGSQINKRELPPERRG